MCGACAGGAVASKTTAYLNHYGLKQAALRELRSQLPRGHRLNLFGDRWVLRGSTGSHRIFGDIEDLLGYLGMDQVPNN